MELCLFFLFVLLLSNNRKLLLLLFISCAVSPPQQFFRVSRHHQVAATIISRSVVNHPPIQRSYSTNILGLNASLRPLLSSLQYVHSRVQRGVTPPAFRFTFLSQTRGMFPCSLLAYLFPCTLSVTETIRFPIFAFAPHEYLFVFVFLGVLFYRRLRFERNSFRSGWRKPNSYRYGLIVPHGERDFGTVLANL